MDINFSKNKTTLNNKIFEYGNYENKLNNNNLIDFEWSKIESVLQKSRLDDCFQKEEKDCNESISSLNLLKSIEFNNLNYDNYTPLSEIKELNIESHLQRFIHPIENDFEKYIIKKIEQFENLKKTKYRNGKENINNNTIIENKSNYNNINKRIERINGLLQTNQNISDEYSIVREKNKTNFNFLNSNENKNYNNNFNNIFEQRHKKKSFLEYSPYKTKNVNLFGSKENSDLVNKPNDMSMIGNNKKDSKLQKIRGIYSELWRNEKNINNYKDNGYKKKDYFQSILSELNLGN